MGPRPSPRCQAATRSRPPGPDAIAGRVELAVEMGLGARRRRPARRPSSSGPGPGPGAARLPLAASRLDGLQAPTAAAPVGDRDRRGRRVELGLEPRPRSPLDRPLAGRPGRGARRRRPRSTGARPGPGRAPSRRRPRPRWRSAPAVVRGARPGASQSQVETASPSSGRSAGSWPTTTCEPVRTARGPTGSSSLHRHRGRLATEATETTSRGRRVAAETITRNRSPGRAESRSA